MSAGRINSQLLAFDDSVRLLFTILQTSFAVLEIKEAGEAPASWVTPIKSYCAASNNSFSCLLAAAAASSTDESRTFVRQEMIKNDDPLLRRELLQIGRFDRAADIDAHRLVMVEKASQMKARTADIVNGHMDLVKIRRPVEKVKLEFRNEFGQQDRIGTCHTITSILGYSDYTRFAQVSQQGKSFVVPARFFRIFPKKVLAISNAIC